MEPATIPGSLYRELLENGYKNLAAHFQAINDLNVFPVPDGDTGTNMKLTYANGMKALGESEEIGEITNEFAKGMLLGARGNSGVLTSQYFKGIANSLKETKDITVMELAEAMRDGYKTAYRATVTPTEGTILTVAREGIESVYPRLKAGKTDLTSFLAMVIEAMKISLDRTPYLLPVLKESGVVDSGGKGLLTIFEGMYKYMINEPIDGKEVELDISHSALPSVDISAFNEDSVLDYGYCTEFLLQLLNAKIKVEEFNIDGFIESLKNMGNSIVCFQTGTIVKVHIHTKKPYEVIEFAQRYGEFVSFKMENMAMQHNEVVQKKEEKCKDRKKVAIVAIAQGEGIKNMFKEMGADIVIDGGKTMNTSASEMVDAFQMANADEIVILPNESNILMAAKQAAELYKGSKVYVVETKSIPEGYAALSMLMGDEENAKTVYQEMNDGISTMVPGFLTQSIRDTRLNHVRVKNGDYIGGLHGKLVVSLPEKNKALVGLLGKIKDIKKCETVILFYGKSISEEEANGASEAIKEKYPNLEVGLIPGGQEVYDYLLGVN